MLSYNGGKGIMLNLKDKGKFIGIMLILVYCLIFIISLIGPIQGWFTGITILILGIFTFTALIFLVGTVFDIATLLFEGI